MMHSTREIACSSVDSNVCTNIAAVERKLVAIAEEVWTAVSALEMIDQVKIESRIDRCGEEESQWKDVGGTLYMGGAPNTARAMLASEQLSVRKRERKG